MLRRFSVEQRIAFAVMAAVTAFVVWQLQPGLIFRHTTAAEGDLAGHYNVAHHFRNHVLPDWRLSGWNQDWFTGYASLTFYFPLAFLLIAFLDLLLPFTMALKAVASTGPVLLPLAAYAFGRLNRCDRLTSACLGVSVLPLLLHSKLFIGGGSISASAGGEFSYSLGLALALLVVGLARSGLRTGRLRALTAGLLAVTFFGHIIHAVMAVVAITVATLLRPAWARARWTASVLAGAGLLAGFWIVPFALRSKYTSGLPFPKSQPLTEWLFPLETLPVVPLALAGALLAVPADAEERDLKWFLVAMAVVAGAVFAAVPAGRVSNVRFLSHWFLWLCLLAGYGTAQLARVVDAWRRRSAHGRRVDGPAVAGLAAPAVLLLVLLVLFDSRGWPGMLSPTSTGGWTAMAKQRFGGWEQSPDRAEFGDYIETVRGVARDHGCGRTHLEVANELHWSNSRQSLVWQTPRFTDGCLTTTQGYFDEASPSSVAIEEVNARLSSLWRDPLDGTTTYDFAAGLTGLRTLGVRYLMATTANTVMAADASPDLRPVAETKVHAGNRFWKIYEVEDVEMVEPLGHLPVVVPGIGGTRTTWETAVRRWFDDVKAHDVVVATSGPSAWPRRERVSDDLPRRPITESTEVSRVRIENDRISFRVSRTGVPVLVKVSWFPNWEASGAEGPYRVTPNQMVVVPTSEEVTLRYGRTPPENLGWLATLAGVGGVVFLARRGPVDIPEPGPRPERVPKRPPPRPPAHPKSKKRRR